MILEEMILVRLIKALFVNRNISSINQIVMLIRYISNPEEIVKMVLNVCGLGIFIYTWNLV